METTFGVLCLIPPILAIVLALITKQTILSLLIATWVGSTTTFQLIFCGALCWSPCPAG